MKTWDRTTLPCPARPRRPAFKNAVQIGSGAVLEDLERLGGELVDDEGRQLRQPQRLEGVGRVDPSIREPCRTASGLRATEGNERAKRRVCIMPSQQKRLVARLFVRLSATAVDLGANDRWTAGEDASAPGSNVRFRMLESARAVRITGGEELVASASADKDGRGDRIRTCDLLLPKQTRYQAALRPDLNHDTSLASNGCNPYLLTTEPSV